MPPPTSKPSHADNLAEAGRAATAAVNVALPATIVSYDRTTQRATVQLVPSFRRKGAGGEVLVERPPTIPGVPVAFPGGGDFGITWPLAAGDSGLVVFCDRSTDEWLSMGGDHSEPQDPRRHDIMDAVFLPGLRSFAEAVPSDGTDATALVIRAATMKLGSSSATKAVALAPDVATALGTIKTALQTAATAAGAGATAGDGGVTAFAAFASALSTALAAWPPTMAASKVQAE